MMALVLMKPHHFMPPLIWITLSLQTLPSFSEQPVQREAAPFLLMVEREACKIPLFLSIENVEEPFPHFI